MRQLQEWMRQHIGPVLTALVFVTLGLRVLAVTRGDVSGALAVLQSADPVKVLIGMGLQLLPWFPLVIGAVVISARANASLAGPAGERQRDAGLCLVVGAASVVVASLLVPYAWGYLIVIGVGLLVVLLGAGISRDSLPGVLRARNRAKDAERWTRLLRRSRFVAIGLTLVVYVVLALSPTMWLPREEIARAGKSMTVGFVLSRDSDSTVVLTSRARSVIHLDSSAIRSRRTCVLEEWDRPLLFKILGGQRAEHPECSKS